MKGTKKWWQSMGAWGGGGILIHGISLIFGYSITEADARDIQVLINGLIESVGGLIALIGRLRANKIIEK